MSCLLFSMLNLPHILNIHKALRYQNIHLQLSYICITPKTICKIWNPFICTYEILFEVLKYFFFAAPKKFRRFQRLRPTIISQSGWLRATPACLATNSSLRPPSTTTRPSLDGSRHLLSGTGSVY